MMIRVVVSGTGNMGTIVRDAIDDDDGMEMVGVIEPLGLEGEHRFPGDADYLINADPVMVFESVRPDVVVDFTNAQFTPVLVEAALNAGVRPVIGTSGVDAETVEALRRGCDELQLGGVVAPNFALGAVVLMYLAGVAARYFDAAEIVELHHDRKVDAPSGTALETARLMRSVRDSDFVHPDPEINHIDGARGGVEGGVGIHSVRLPGLVAHQEVIFGDQAQTLSLRHDSSGRDSFIPGVLLAIRTVTERDGLVVGLNRLMGLD